ncbi:MAG TPA: aminoglycoside phosphotransferase family protein [Streptosporangiaceae bacterium]|nr:aminoglycoside phosphotransferase family protein [Streptosporangiaceae bacterium]HVB43256.1 aminoglycoside phosphotransferase family protein [Streptosporangiaceae bacterium]
MSEGEPLTGGSVTEGIVRIGDTVRRPLRPFSLTVQAYLGHLRDVGFAGAPLPLGVDEQGREILSFVPGQVHRHPLPPEAAGDDMLVALARLIRKLHEASAGWVPPPGAVWGGTPASQGQVAGRAELVSHRDYATGNVVFRGGLIDFDLAMPTTRLYDITNALWYWAPLKWGDPRDRAPALATTVVHLLANGVRLKTVPSRLTVAHLQRLLAEGARPAGPPPIPSGEAGDPIEVDRLVNGTGLISLAGRQHPIGYHFAGRRLTVRLDHGLLQLVQDGMLLRSLPNPLTPSELARIRDARPAGPPPQPAAEPVQVERRVSSRGAITIARQRIHIGIVHAGRTLTVESADHTFRIYDGDQLLAETGRTTTKPIARFKIRKPEPPRQRHPAQGSAIWH